ncbi:MAG: hypothetical protein AB8G99_13790 [Planctomycetaceae bacterium]
MNTKRTFDPFRPLEYLVAIFVINITLFTIIWKTVGLSWLPFGLAEAFQDVFTAGYYPRDTQRHELAYDIFFLITYGLLGTAAQFASLQIARNRRREPFEPGRSRWVFASFHIVIAAYHVLFVFQIVKGKMLLDNIPPWQMIATQVLYVLEFIMAVELLFLSNSTFFRRKVCLDLLSACNLLPLLFFWGFAIAGYNDPAANKLVGTLLFAILPLALMATEWGTWMASAQSDKTLAPSTAQQTPQP